jgi:Domain of unknown function (DUF397)
MAEDHEPTWRRSSRCGESSCVEVADGGEVVLLRCADAGTQISVPRHAFRMLIEAVKAGQLDGPTTA